MSNAGGEQGTRLPAGTGFMSRRSSKSFVTVCTPQSSRGVLSVAALGNRASREAASALCPCVVEPTSEACLCGNKGRLVSYSQWGRQADIYETDSKVSI